VNCRSSAWSPRLTKPERRPGGHSVHGRGTVYRVECSAWYLLWWLVSVRYALLALLSEGPRHGLQLREELQARTGEVWPLNVGQLYATLGRLERDGLVESDSTQAAGPHKEFRITTDGTGELATWLRTPPDPASAPHGQMAEKVLAALRVPGTDVHEVVQVHRRSLIEGMQQWTRIKQEKAGNDLGLGLRIDAELFWLGSVIRWLDAADGRLMNAAVSLPHPDRNRAAEDRVRVGDRDRERATARLRDCYAEGRLTREELEERITAALSAQTVGDLRRITADLP
jgi:DNA-binding PadR family transcriptional regulator